MQKMNIRKGAGLITIGLVVILIGAYNRNYIGTITRLTGVIVSGAGMVVMGKRLYERIQVRAKEKTRLLRKAKY